MISIVVTLPNFSFFGDACLRNIYETIGLDQKDFEIIFLMTDTPTFPIESKLPYKLVKLPIKAEKGSQLSLLNHAFYQLPLQEWVYVQHADMFWTEVGWGIDLMSAIKNSPNKIAWMVPHSGCLNEFNCVKHKFALDSQKLTRTHDFAGLYNRTWFTKAQMNFQWGELQELLPISIALKTAIEQKRLQWIHRGHEVRFGEFIDGSDLIGLEIGTNYPNLIGTIPTIAKYIHCWDLFGISYDLHRENDTLIINRLEEKCVRSLHIYSWISSNLLTTTEKIFPWKVLQNINCNIKKNKSVLCHFLEKYKTNTKSIGEDDACGITTVRFKDKIYHNG